MADVSPDHRVDRPRDNRGHFVPLSCPYFGCSGRLVYEGRGIWRCDGLIDPEDENKELEACGFFHVDGEFYETP